MPANRQRKLPPPKVLDALSEKLKTGAADVDRIGRELGLNDRQITWAKLYAANAYNRNVQKITMEAYPNANYNTAAVQGNQLMRHPCVMGLVDIIYVGVGASDLQIYKNIVETMQQSINFPAKIQAARTLLEAKGKLKDIDINMNITHTFDVTKLTTEELEILERAAIRNKIIDITGRTKEAESGDDNSGIVPSEPV